MTWIDTTILVVVGLGGLFLFYRALKEPMDMLFGYIGRAFGWAGGKISGAGQSMGPKVEVITYE